MKVSEKTLELNIGAELLMRLRGHPALRKLYLRGLTQKEERAEGVDFFAQLDPATKMFAFQFKAPKGKHEKLPYRFKIVDYQHAALWQLAKGRPQTVFYVLPFYVAPGKVQRDSPRLLVDSWFLDISTMPPAAIFGGHKTRTITCVPHKATVNPSYHLIQGVELMIGPDAGVGSKTFGSWYTAYIAKPGSRPRNSDGARLRKNPYLVRGLRVAIAVPPEP